MKKLTLLINSIFFNYLISFASLNLLIITLYFFNYKNAVIEVALFGSFVSVACQIFSFNSRSLLLSKKIKLSFENAIFQRIFFSFPIFLITLSFIFFYNFSDKTLVFVILLAIISNWLLELVFSDKELKSKSSVKSHLVFSILIYLLIVLFLFINNIFLTKICIFSFSILNFSILYNVLNKKILKLKLPILEFKNIFKILLLSSFGSSLSIGISNFFFRYFIIELAPVQTASTIIIGFMFGSLPLSLFSIFLAHLLLKIILIFLRS